LSTKNIFIFSVWLRCRSCYGAVNEVTGCGFSTWWQWNFSCQLWPVQTSCRLSCVKISVKNLSIGVKVATF